MDFNLSWTHRAVSAPDISNSGALFRRVIIDERYYPYNHTSCNSTPSLNAPNTNSLLSSLSPTSPATYFQHNSSKFCASGLARDTRHHSCDQLANIGRVHAGYSPNETLDDTVTQSNSFHPAESTLLLAFDHESVFNDSPMEVDIADTSNSTPVVTDCLPPKIKKEPTILDYVDLTYEGSNCVLKRKPKEAMPRQRRHRNYKSDKGKTANSNKGMKFLLGIVTVAIGLFSWDRMHYNYNIDTQSLQNDFKISVFGQEEALAQIGSAVEKFALGSTQDKRSILSFVGTTGVGKTLCMNIIKRHFQPKQIIEITIDTFVEIELYRDHIPYLVLLDGLRASDLPKLRDLLKSVSDNKWILVITTFNTVETDDMQSYTIDSLLHERIQKDLSNLNYTVEVVQFKTLTYPIIDDNLLGLYNIYFEYVNSIPQFKQILAQHDFERLGLKGLIEKMNLVG